MADATVFVSLAFFGVWMQRKKRWSLFFQALEGKYSIGPSSSGTASSGIAGASGSGSAPVTQAPTGIPSNFGG